jgi:hypothetical protein
VLTQGQPMLLGDRKLNFTEWKTTPHSSDNFSKTKKKKNLYSEQSFLFIIAIFMQPIHK